ncbi:MAG: acyltransferase [Limisphaerales bacterium]
MVDGAQFVSVGDFTKILGHAHLATFSQYAGQTFQPRLDIGSLVYVGPYCVIACCQSVTIEDDCVISQDVYITDCSHGPDPNGGPIMDQRLKSRGPVRVGRGILLWYRACTMDGVTLGSHCVVGANSVVTRDVPDYCMVGGVPARATRRYDPAKSIWTRA